MRWLSFASLIDMQGASFPGLWWAINDIKSRVNEDHQHMPVPISSSAVLAMEPIDVIQIKVAQPIDTAKNESGEKEMKEVGYSGNANRQAIPIIVVRYATSLPGIGSYEASITFDHERIAYTPLTYSVLGCQKSD